MVKNVVVLYSSKKLVIYQEQYVSCLSQLSGTTIVGAIVSFVCFKNKYVRIDASFKKTIILKRYILFLLTFLGAFNVTFLSLLTTLINHFPLILLDISWISWKRRLFCDLKQDLGKSWLSNKSGRTSLLLHSWWRYWFIVSWE